MIADASESIDFLAQFRQRESQCRDAIDLLKEKAHPEYGRMWAHHLPGIIDRIEFFRGLLQDEIDHFGEWRYHEFQPDEVLDFIDDDLNELTRWLCRMTNTKRLAQQN